MLKHGLSPSLLASSLLKISIRQFGDARTSVQTSNLPVAHHDVAGLNDAEKIGRRADGEVHAAVAAATLLVQRAAERGLPVGIVQTDDVANNDDPRK